MQEAAAHFAAEAGCLVHSLERWLRAAAAVLETDAAILVLADKQASRVIAAHGLIHAFQASGRGFESLPYGAHDEVLVPDATARPDLHRLLADRALENTGAFFRFPVLVTEDVIVALLAFSGKPGKPRTPRTLALTREITGTIATEIEGQIGSLAEPFTSSRPGLSLAQLRLWLENRKGPALLLDENLNVLGKNAALDALPTAEPEFTIGSALEDYRLPARDSLAFFFRNALTTMVSTPRIEIAQNLKPIPVGADKLWSVVASPLQLTDRDAPVLVVTVADITEFGERRDKLEKILPGSPNPAAATVEFLRDTLVHRRALKSRGDISYVTLRAWRQSIKSHQLKALKAIKRHEVALLAGEMAGEFAAEITALIGPSAFRAIVPVGCGHSPEEKCLSLALAVQLGSKLQVPVVKALYQEPQTGVSHPKTNVTRPPMRLAAPVVGPVLLVDDVATSGRHIEEAVTLLRPTAGSVLSLAWISGETDRETEAEA